jgi:hypothetical protein
MNDVQQVDLLNQRTDRWIFTGVLYGGTHNDISCIFHQGRPLLIKPTYRSFSLTWSVAPVGWWNNTKYLNTKELIPVPYTNMAAISLFWYTNMAAVTSDENDLFTRKYVEKKKNCLQFMRRIFSFLFRYIITGRSTSNTERSTSKKSSRICASERILILLDEFCHWQDLTYIQNASLNNRWTGGWFSWGAWNYKKWTIHKKYRNTTRKCRWF